MSRLPCVLVLLVACSNDPEPIVDGGVADAMPGDSGEHPDAAAPDAEPAPVAPYTAPERIRVDKWMVAQVPSSNPLVADINKGTFTYPEPGFDQYNNRWSEIEPNENGRIENFGRGMGYAVAKLELTEPTRLIAMPDRILSIHFGASRQPGDPYGHHNKRIPLLAQAGENLLILRVHGGRGEPEIRIWKTTDEVHFNLQDVTRPDPVRLDDTEQYLGVHMVNLKDQPVSLTARVLENEHFEATTEEVSFLPAKAATQVGFLLRPKAAFQSTGEIVTADLRIESSGLDFSYERPYELTVVTATATAFRRTFRSPIDGSIQYYGVQQPRGFDPARKYALVLSLHGAGVEGIGQARAYSKKEWAYVIAPTNRRRFGFDWEEWGHFNAIASLDHAMSQFEIDATKVYLTGHSMGGHGTWHNGVMNAGRFAVVAPSAGWSSFYSYTGYPEPTGPFARSRAHSNTLNYLENLARRGVYIIHGSADDNVPVREGRDMFAAVSQITSDLLYHEEPGAGHWWDGDQSDGADCVDWPPLFDFFETHTVDPFELDFRFTSPGAHYSPSHSFVTLQSSLTPYEDLVVTSSSTRSTVVITTRNVRSMEIDGDALLAKGINEVVIDGQPQVVSSGTMVIGPQDGKRRDLHGPYNQVYHRPFCFVYPDDGQAYAEYASYLTTGWSIIGNGRACALPYSSLTDAIADEYNLIHLGLTKEQARAPAEPFDWDANNITLDGSSRGDTAMLFVYPRGDRLSAALATTEGEEHLLYYVVPFSSTVGMPDYLVWGDGYYAAAGYFDPKWAFDPSLGVP